MPGGRGCTSHLARGYRLCPDVASHVGLSLSQPVSRVGQPFDVLGSLSWVCQATHAPASFDTMATVTNHDPRWPPWLVLALHTGCPRCDEPYALCVGDV